MEVRMPHQAFINGNFVDSSSGKTFITINPHDEAVRQWTIRVNFDRANKNEIHHHS
jgi:hypothetical protein